LLTFIVLGLIAVAALGWRLLTDRAETPAGRREQRAGNRGSQEQPQPTESEPTPTETPSLIVIPDGLIGADIQDAEASLKAAGFEIAKEDVDSDEQQGIVVGVAPESGSEVAPGTPITLFVSRGPQEPPDSPPGEEKKEKDEDDD
jgi:hypothetical protein